MNPWDHGEVQTQMGFFTAMAVACLSVLILVFFCLQWLHYDWTWRDRYTVKVYRAGIAYAGDVKTFNRMMMEDEIIDGQSKEGFLQENPWAGYFYLSRDFEDIEEYSRMVEKSVDSGFLYYQCLAVPAIALLVVAMAGGTQARTGGKERYPFRHAGRASGRRRVIQQLNEA